jgi:oligopeptide transport system substrate-binding protein
MFMCTKSQVVAILIALAAIGGFSSCSRTKAEPANTVHLTSVAKIKGLDPIFSDDLYSGIEVAHAYEGLLQYHYLKRPYTLIPNLAEAMPTISKDGKTYTFKIKKGVVFQDDPCFKATNGKGRELTADDFIYSWKRLADPKLNSSGWWVFDGKIVGLNEWHDAAAKSGAADYSKPIEGLKAVDPYTLQITLKNHSAQFLYFLAMQFTAVVPHEAVEMYGPEFLNHAVGTGPYHLTEYNPSSRLIWDRNPTYRKEFYPTEGEPGDKEAGLLEDAGKPLPLNDRVVTEIFEESQPMWLKFMAGKVDAIAIPKDNFSQAVNSAGDLTPEFKAKNFQLTKAPTLDVTHISFNMIDPIVGKNKYLRQAMSLAYDSIKYIDLFYNGRAISAQGPIPPGIAGYDPDFKNPYRQYNVTKAKELLAKAGYPGGKGLPPLEYLTLSDTTSRQDAEYSQSMFKQLGIELKVTTSSWPEFVASVKNRKGQLYGQAWAADYPDAENFLQLFYSKNMSPGPNDANYSNPEFDKLYEKSLTLDDSPQRTELYKQMVKILVDDCPWIFGAHRLTYGLSQPWLRNLKYHDVDLARFKYLRVDPAAKSGK